MTLPLGITVTGASVPHMYNGVVRGPAGPTSPAGPVGPLPTKIGG